MRLVMKGGVWKNNEDEVLKAAVMKYGLNNWSRVASLLNRKTARQCKARWYEWLDPSVKKTPWSKAEDEKLLHMAKLFPTQWKTIAPLVGRTANQCVQRYSELLDIAAGKEPNALGDDDPRKLRPGEMDPNPETRPARADAADLDEDEREMLAEARARLANTKGKKAKRKAREKQLEERKRIALLQKRRELKAAGVSVGSRLIDRKSDGVDYENEVPFEVKPKPGIHDTTEEEKRSVAEAAISNLRLQQIEAARARERARKLRLDERKLLRKLHEHHLPEILATQVDDPFAVRQHNKLTLPKPAVSDQEIAQLAQAVAKADNALTEQGSSLSGLFVSAHGTKNLLPTATPARGLTTDVTTPAALRRSKRSRKSEITIMSLLSGLPEAKSGIKIDVASENYESNEMQDNEDYVPDERDRHDERMMKKNQLLKTLESVNARTKLFADLYPRPFDLPDNVEEIVEMVFKQQNGSMDELTAEADKLINFESAQLLLSDQAFLSPDEHLKLCSNPKTYETAGKIKSAFLAHNARQLQRANVAVPFLQKAVEELELELNKLEECSTDVFEKCSSILEKIPDHLCAYDDEQNRYIAVAKSDPRYEEVMIRNINAEVATLNTLASMKESRLNKLKDAYDRLTSGYREKISSSLMSLDKWYDYELELLHTSGPPPSLLEDGALCIKNDNQKALPC